VIHRAFVIFLTVSSFALALCCIVSHWHPTHLSEVWDDGATWVDCTRGWGRWFYETGRWKAQSGRTWTSPGFVLTGGLGFQTRDDGFRTIGIPGLRVEWCCQPNGYRRFDVRVGFFAFALLAILYPTLLVASGKIRQLVRHWRGACLNCGYDLTGNESGTCPECGIRIETEPKAESG
jgi:hypothetical protein